MVLKSKKCVCYIKKYNFDFPVVNTMLNTLSLRNNIQSYTLLSFINIYIYIIVFKDLHHVQVLLSHLFQYYGTLHNYHFVLLVHLKIYPSTNRYHFLLVEQQVIVN